MPSTGAAGFYAANDTSTTLTVNSTETATQITITGPATYGNPVPLKAAVLTSTGVATGTVTFMDANVHLATKTLDGQGNASTSTSSLTAGVHNLWAKYSGDTRFQSSTADTETQLINKAQPTFAVSSSTIDYGTANVTLSGTLNSTRLPRPLISQSLFYWGRIRRLPSPVPMDRSR
jgi:large repetitive protein